LGIGFLTQLASHYGLSGGIPASNKDPEGLLVNILSATVMPLPVPEPATFSLLGLSGLLLAGRFFKSKKSN